jgi:hypothetical protein
MPRGGTLIVRDAGSDWLLISQPDHAAWRRACCARGRSGRSRTAHPRRRAVRHRTPRHRLVRRRRRADARSATGRPCDFVSSRSAAAASGAVPAPAPQSTYAAALVAQHALTAYRPYATTRPGRRSSPRWSARAITGIAPTRGPTARRAVLDPQGADRLQFLADYGALRLGDVASLILCNRWTAPQSRKPRTSTSTVTR